MNRLKIGLVILAATAALAGCGSCGATPAATPAIGDSCLVGTWTLQHEENKSGYSYAGTPVAVSGLAGAKLQLAADGSDTEVFDGSRPLVGVAPDGRTLSISIAGSVKYSIRGDGHNYTETGGRVDLPTVAMIDGATIAGYQSYYTAGGGTYTCSSRSVTFTTSTGIQTDTWSKA